MLSEHAVPENTFLTIQTVETWEKEVKKKNNPPKLKLPDKSIKILFQSMVTFLAQKEAKFCHC